MPYIDIYVYMYIYICSFAFIYIHMFAYTYVHVYIYIYIHTFVHTYMYVCTLGVNIFMHRLDVDMFMSDINAYVRCSHACV